MPAFLIARRRVQELAERLAAVLLVVYLVFNEGYNAAGEGRVLSDEAIRLGRLLVELLPGEPEVARPARPDAAT